MLNPDFREMLSALTEEDAEFLVVGAYALAVHGAWERRVTLEVDGIPVLVLGREDLIRNKRAVGRTRDVADIEALEEGGGSP